MKLSLVTVLFNSDNVLEGFFKSLHLQSLKEYDLYLVDNTPSQTTDELLEQLKAQYPLQANIHHIKNDKNLGVATGNNQGIIKSLESGHNYTILLNNDIEFDNTLLLEELVTYADSHPEESMIIPKIYFWDNRKIWMAGGTINKFTGVTSHVGEGNSDGESFSKNSYFNYAPTCFMLIRNNLFQEIGMMDEKYFVYYDDTDFVFRAVSTGKKVLMLSHLHVYHKVSSSTGGGESLFTIYYGNRNRIHFIRKNLKGFYNPIAMTYTLATRFIKHIQYTPAQRDKMWQGIKDGFKL